ncbi:MAG: MBL fold metallo-hydrolase [Hadesarchaea archaeon]|nr:MBL fold metallo-hydrolase [Hadesarchaea archaeon]
MKITIVYDNEVLKGGLTAGWGFSCLIDDDVLFDTGDDGMGLLHNMRELSIDPGNIKSVVLSHGHGDHIGGLPELLEENQKLTVYALPSFSKWLESQIPAKTKLVEVRKPMQIRESVFTTGPLGTRFEEQSLVCLDKKGAFVITGCSHPGLGSILSAASKFGEVYGVIGGFHGFSDFDILKEVKLISPCHCTSHKEELARMFPKQHLRCGAGLVVK